MSRILWTALSISFAALFLANLQLLSAFRSWNCASKYSRSCMLDVVEMYRAVSMKLRRCSSFLSLACSLASRSSLICVSVWNLWQAYCVARTAWLLFVQSPMWQCPHSWQVCLVLVVFAMV